MNIVAFSWDFVNSFQQVGRQNHVKTFLLSEDQVNMITVERRVRLLPVCVFRIIDISFFESLTNGEISPNMVYNSTFLWYNA